MNLAAVSITRNGGGRDSGALPIPRQPLLGRDAELVAIRSALLEPETPLVNLMGAPGVGKTRLALEVAATTADHFPDGVMHLDLSALSGPEGLAGALAAALHLDVPEGQAPFETIAAFLADRRILLLLDGFERVLPAAPLVQALLGRCRSMKILATSRVRLGLPGEVTIPVLPLAVPGEHQLSLHTAYRYGAVALFCRQAQAVRPDFVLSEENLPAIASICARLDGIPLAIELAADWIRVLPPAIVLEALAHPLELLWETPRYGTGPARALRSELERSVQGLVERERILLRRLAVCTGGAALPAIELLSDENGSGLLHTLAGLIDSSVLMQVAGTDGQARYVMPGLVRDYALELLEQSGEAAELRRRHALHYLELAEIAEPHIESVEQDVWLQCLDEERGNLRAALAWAVENEEAEIAQRLAGALWLWFCLTSPVEGRSWAERALRVPDARSKPVAHAGALFTSGYLATCMGDFVEGLEPLRQSVAIWRTTAQRRRLAWSLLALGQNRANSQEGRQAALLEAQALFEEVGDSRGAGSALVMRFNDALAEGDTSQALGLVREMIALAHSSDDSLVLAVAVGGVGRLEAIQGRLRAAKERYAEALELARQGRQKRIVASLLSGLAEVALQSGEVAQARELFAEALHLGQDIGFKLAMLSAAEGLARVASVTGYADRGGQLLASVTGVREELSVGRSVSTPEHGLRVVKLPTEGARVANPSADYLFSMDAIVGSADELARLLGQGQAGSRSSGPLSQREWQVLRLVAAGNSNRQIAEVLVVSERTVVHHIEHIYRKIGARNRAEATAYALREDVAATAPAEREPESTVADTPVN